MHSIIYSLYMQLRLCIILVVFRTGLKVNVMHITLHYEYHSLIWRETTAPIDLHMGVVLPFMSACLGPRTKGLFLTCPTVLNLFWINVATSSVGKSVTYHHFISQPLKYMINKSAGHVPDFEISLFM